MARHPYLDGPYPRAYAHRGWHIDDLAGLENTLVAFHRAVDEGFGYLELDVHASTDGVPVVHHDPTLDRTTDGTGRVDVRSVAQLAGVRVGGREPIPTLEQVLVELPDVRITVELKSAAVVGPVLALLERTDSWHRVCLGGYDRRWLDRARRAAGPRLCTSMGQWDAIGLRGRAWLGVLPRPLPGVLGSALPVRGQLAQLPRRLGVLTVVDRRLVQQAHADDQEVHVWTVDHPAMMTALLDMGVDGLLSDRPDVLRRVLRERGQWPERLPEADHGE